MTLKTTFRKLLAPSTNQRANAELLATVLGRLSNVRSVHKALHISITLTTVYGPFSFLSITDRFLHELNPLAAGQVPKDSDARFENIVMGLRYIEINVSGLPL